MTRVPALCLCCLLLLAACASEDLRPDFEGAQELIKTTTGLEHVYDPETPPLGRDEIDAALSDGLGRDEALRLALLNSRRLQAGFMGLGVARADYVQSGLLQNPTLGLSFLFPAGSARTRVAGTLAMNVSEIWRLPERRQVAETVMQQRLLELGRLAGQLVADTRTAYARSVAARELALSARELSALSVRALQAVRAQVDLGVATELEAQWAQADVLATDLDARRAARQEAEAVRNLASLLSLTDDLQGVVLVDRLPDDAPTLPDREALVAQALAMRLDLRAFQTAVAGAEARVLLERERARPELVAGLGYERPESDSPSDHVLGPTLGVELPIFDANEAQISRAEYELEQLRRALEALDSELRQQVRAAADGAQLALATSRFLQDELLPQAQRTAALAQEAFERGSTTLMPLLNAERALAKAHVFRIESALEAVLTTVELERALGGPLPTGDGIP